jgi:hypothetical protein
MIGVSAVAAVRRWSEMDDSCRDLALGIIASLIFYLFFNLVTQGHGWGWRYGHQVLGSVMLLAAWAWPRFSQTYGQRRMALLAVLSIGFTIALQTPTRIAQVRHFSLPFVKANEWLSRQKAAALIIPVDSIWYGRDLIRNELPLSLPVRVNGSAGVPDGLRRVLARNGQVLIVSTTELQSLGLEVVGRH